MACRARRPSRELHYRNDRGLFGNPPKSKQLTHGIADKIIRDLSATGDLHLVMGGVSLNALYNEVALGRWVERKFWS